jgi:putative membrane protein
MPTSAPFSHGSEPHSLSSQPGLAIAELLPRFDVAGGRRAVALPLIALGTITAAVSYRQWRTNERALRRGWPLPTSRLPVLVAVGVTAVAALALVLSALR